MTQPLSSYDCSATREYLGVVHRHVIKPLEGTAAGDSCFAAALLIFAAIDGLGRLLHSDSGAGVAERFKSFLPRLGPQYEALGNELWEVRNSLVHNAMNVACFMSKTEDAQGEHLERERGYVFLHTGRLLQDFKGAISRLETDLRTDGALLEQTESRLEWDAIAQPGWRGGEVKTTPPPGIRFVKLH